MVSDSVRLLFLGLRGCRGSTRTQAVATSCTTKANRCRHHLQPRCHNIESPSGYVIQRLPSSPIYPVVAEFISPKKVYTVSSIGDYGIPRCVKCTHSANKSTSRACPTAPPPPPPPFAILCPANARPRLRATNLLTELGFLREFLKKGFQRVSWGFGGFHEVSEVFLRFVLGVVGGGGGFVVFWGVSLASSLLKAVLRAFHDIELTRRLQIVRPSGGFFIHAQDFLGFSGKSSCKI